MSFANFVFYPLVVGTIIAVIIEQIFRATGNEDDPKAVRNVFLSMGVRKYLWRQAWLFNIIWFVGYFILLVTNRPGQQQMPDMIWQGYMIPLALLLTSFPPGSRDLLEFGFFVGVGITACSLGLLA